MLADGGGSLHVTARARCQQGSQNLSAQKPLPRHWASRELPSKLLEAYPAMGQHCLFKNCLYLLLR